MGEKGVWGNGRFSSVPFHLVAKSRDSVIEIRRMLDASRRQPTRGRSSKLLEKENCEFASDIPLHN